MNFKLHIAESIVEDDPHLSQSLKIDLERCGYIVDTAMDGEAGDFKGATDSYDLAVLDLGLPKLSGLEVLARWRKADNHLPVIILTARDSWYEKVDGFKAGADDYLGKPFHIEELLARINALLKRLSGTKKSQLMAFNMKLDDDAQAVIVDEGRRIELTAVEFRLLRYFMLHPGKVLSKSLLAEHVLEKGCDLESNILEVYINRLRHKISKTLIHTRRGQGYVFDEER